MLCYQLKSYWAADENYNTGHQREISGWQSNLEVYVENYLPKYAWSDYSFSSLIAKFDDTCANRTPAISESGF